MGLIIPNLNGGYNKFGGGYMSDGKGNATKIGGMYYADGKGNATKAYSPYLPTGYVIFDGGGYATAFNNVFSVKGSILGSVKKIKIVKTNKVVLPFSINKLKTGIVISSSMFAELSYDKSYFISTPLNGSSGYNFKSPISITKAELLKGYVYGSYTYDNNSLSIKLVGNSLVFSSNAPLRYNAPSGTYGTATEFNNGSMFVLLVDSITAYWGGTVFDLTDTNNNVFSILLVQKIVAI